MRLSPISWYVLLLLSATLSHAHARALCEQKAKKKPLDVRKIADLGIDIKPRVQTLSVEDPPVRSAGVKVASIEELVQKLKSAGSL
jgi:electron transfer flavoprotein alpha/beta subunit